MRKNHLTFFLLFSIAQEVFCMPQRLPTANSIQPAINPQRGQNEHDNIRQQIQNSLRRQFDITYSSIDEPSLLENSNINLQSQSNNEPHNDKIEKFVFILKDDIPLPSHNEIVSKPKDNLLVRNINRLPITNSNTTQPEISIDRPIPELDTQRKETNTTEKVSFDAEKINVANTEQEILPKAIETVAENEPAPTTVAPVTPDIAELVEEPNDLILNDIFEHTLESEIRDQNERAENDIKQVPLEDTTTLSPEIEIETVPTIDSTDKSVIDAERSIDNELNINRGKTLVKIGAKGAFVREGSKNDGKPNPNSNDNIAIRRFTGRTKAKRTRLQKNGRVRKMLKSVRKVTNAQSHLKNASNKNTRHKVPLNVRTRTPTGNGNNTARRKPTRRTVQRRIITRSRPVAQRRQTVSKPVKKESVALFKLIDSFTKNANQSEASKTEDTADREETVERKLPARRRNNFIGRHRFSNVRPMTRKNRKDRIKASSRRNNTINTQNTSVFIKMDSIMPEGLVKEAEKVEVEAILSDPTAKVDFRVVSSHRTVSVSRKDSRSGVTTILENVSPEKLKSLENIKDASNKSQSIKSSVSNIPINLTLTIVDSLKEELLVKEDADLLKEKKILEEKRKDLATNISEVISPTIPTTNSDITLLATVEEVMTDHSSTKGRTEDAQMKISDIPTLNEEILLSPMPIHIRNMPEILSSTIIEMPKNKEFLKPEDVTETEKNHIFLLNATDNIDKKVTVQTLEENKSLSEDGNEDSGGAINVPLIEPVSVAKYKSGELEGNRGVKTSKDETFLGDLEDTLAQEGLTLNDVEKIFKTTISPPLEQVEETTIPSAGTNDKNPTNRQQTLTKIQPVKEVLIDLVANTVMTPQVITDVFSESMTDQKKVNRQSVTEDIESGHQTKDFSVYIYAGRNTSEDIDTTEPPVDLLVAEVEKLPTPKGPLENKDIKSEMQLSTKNTHSSTKVDGTLIQHNQEETSLPPKKIEILPPIKQERTEEVNFAINETEATTEPDISQLPVLKMQEKEINPRIMKTISESSLQIDDKTDVIQKKEVTDSVVLKSEESANNSQPINEAKVISPISPKEVKLKNMQPIIAIAEKPRILTEFADLSLIPNDLEELILQVEEEPLDSTMIPSDFVDSTTILAPTDFKLISDKAAPEEMHIISGPSNIKKQNEISAGEKKLNETLGVIDKNLSPKVESSTNKTIIKVDTQSVFPILMSDDVTIGKSQPPKEEGVPSIISEKLGKSIKAANSKTSLLNQLVPKMQETNKELDFVVKLPEADQQPIIHIPVTLQEKKYPAEEISTTPIPDEEILPTELVHDTTITPDISMPFDPTYIDISRLSDDEEKLILQVDENIFDTSTPSTEIKDDTTISTPAASKIIPNEMPITPTSSTTGLPTISPYNEPSVPHIKPIQPMKMDVEAMTGTDPTEHIEGDFKSSDNISIAESDYNSTQTIKKGEVEIPPEKLGKAIGVASSSTDSINKLSNKISTVEAGVKVDTKVADVDTVTPFSSISLITTDLGSTTEMPDDSTQTADIVSEDILINVMPEETPTTIASVLSLHNDLADIELSLISDDIQTLILQSEDNSLDTSIPSAMLTENTTHSTTVIRKMPAIAEMAKIELAEDMSPSVVNLQSEIDAAEHKLNNTLKVVEGLLISKIGYTTEVPVPHIAIKSVVGLSDDVATPSDKKSTIKDTKSEGVSENVGKAINAETPSKSRNQLQDKSNPLNDGTDNILNKIQVTNGLREEAASSLFTSGSFTGNTAINTNGPILNRLLEEIIKSVILEKLMDPSIDKLIDSHIHSALNFGQFNKASQPIAVDIFQNDQRGPISSKIFDEIISSSVVSKKDHQLEILEPSVASREKPDLTTNIKTLTTEHPTTAVEMLEIIKHKNEVDMEKLNSTEMQQKLNNEAETIQEASKDLLVTLLTEEMNLNITAKPTDVTNKESEMGSERDTEVPTTVQPIIERKEIDMETLMTVMKQAIEEKARTITISDIMSERLNINLHPTILDVSSTAEEIPWDIVPTTTEIPMKIDVSKGTQEIVREEANVIAKSSLPELIELFTINEQKLKVVDGDSKDESVLNAHAKDETTTHIIKDQLSITTPLPTTMSDLSKPQEMKTSQKLETPLTKTVSQSITVKIGTTDKTEKTVLENIPQKSEDVQISASVDKPKSTLISKTAQIPKTVQKKKITLKLQKQETLNPEIIQISKTVPNTEVTEKLVITQEPKPTEPQKTTEKSTTTQAPIRIQTPEAADNQKTTEILLTPQKLEIILKPLTIHTPKITEIISPVIPNTETDETPLLIKGQKEAETRTTLQQPLTIHTPKITEIISPVIPNTETDETPLMTKGQKEAENRMTLQKPKITEIPPIIQTTEKDLKQSTIKVQTETEKPIIIQKQKKTQGPTLSEVSRVILSQKENQKPKVIQTQTPIIKLEKFETIQPLETLKRKQTTKDSQQPKESQLKKSQEPQLKPKKLVKAAPNTEPFTNIIRGKAIDSFVTPRTLSSSVAASFPQNGSPFRFLPRTNPAFALQFQVGRNAPPALSHFLLSPRPKAPQPHPSRSVVSLKSPSGSVFFANSHDAQQLVSLGLGVPLSRNNNLLRI